MNPIILQALQDELIKIAQEKKKRRWAVPALMASAGGLGLLATGLLLRGKGSSKVGPSALKQALTSPQAQAAARAGKLDHLPSTKALIQRLDKADKSSFEDLETFQKELASGKTWEF